MCQFGVLGLWPQDCQCLPITVAPINKGDEEASTLRLSRLHVDKRMSMAMLSDPVLFFWGVTDTLCRIYLKPRG